MLVRTNRLLWVTALLSLILSFCNSVPLQAQVAGATLSGVITTDSQTPLANASVSIKNLVTGFVRKSKTDKDGQYTAPNLLPGNYEITAWPPDMPRAFSMTSHWLSAPRRPSISP